MFMPNNINILYEWVRRNDGVNGLQLVDQFQEYFHHPKGSALGLLMSAQNIGSLIALPMAPFVTDGYGRRASIFLGGLIMMGGVAWQGMAPNLTHFTLARGVIGFGMSFSVNAAPLLVTELAYPTQRASLTAIYNTMWYAGTIVAAWVTFGTFRVPGSVWSWRIPSVLQGLPSLIQCILIWFCPESPRWLLSKGRDQTAIDILSKYHGSGDMYHPLVEYEYEEIRAAIVVEKSVGNVSYWGLFSSPGNRRRMRIIIALGLFSQWSGNGLITSYMNLILEGVGVTSASKKTLINGVMQLMNLGMAILSALYVERVGRRRLFLTSNVGMLLTFSVWTATTAVYQQTGSYAAALVSVVFIFVFCIFYDFAYTPILVTYVVEILPFRIRAKGFAVLQFTITLALIFNQYVNPVALARLGWKYYFFYIGWLLFELAFVFFYLWETRGRTLEQTAVLFDGSKPNLDPLFIAEAEAARASGKYDAAIKDSKEFRRNSGAKSPTSSASPTSPTSLKSPTSLTSAKTSQKASGSTGGVDISTYYEMKPTATGWAPVYKGTGGKR
ncbi:hypothetical protein FRC04_005284 [Tulasnella sp. 424]|nr:hypothetical protein FRC04_005284 [Tulasnella sp. 424]